MHTSVRDVIVFPEIPLWEMSTVNTFHRHFFIELFNITGI